MRETTIDALAELRDRRARSAEALRLAEQERDQALTDGERRNAAAQVAWFQSQVRMLEQQIRDVEDADEPTL